MDDEEVEYEREDWEEEDLTLERMEREFDPDDFEDEDAMIEYLDELEKAKQKRAEELETYIYTMMGPNAYYGVYQ